jgi:hypothetical protein
MPLITGESDPYVEIRADRRSSPRTDRHAPVPDRRISGLLGRFVDLPWHDGHILTALEAADSVQHRPVRLDALPLGDLGDLAVDVQHAEDSSQVQRAAASAISSA